MDAFYAIDPVNGERVLCSARVNAEIQEYITVLTVSISRWGGLRPAERGEHHTAILKFIEQGREDAPGRPGQRKAYEGFLKWRNEHKEQPIIVQASQITP
jgi:hypothetical protein